MGVGYTTMMYDVEDLHEGLGDVAACRYDGIEIGVEKVRVVGFDSVMEWTDEYDLETYAIMSEWIEDRAAVDRMVEDVTNIADLGAEFIGLLPPQRGRADQETVESWLGEVADAAANEGLRTVVHHHGATAIEQADETRAILDAVSDLELLFDTAHYYPYSQHYPKGDVTDAVERFSDDIAYVHLKDVDPVKDFAANRDALTEGDFHLDNVINYFRSFADLGDGVLDFAGFYDALEEAEYDGHYTIEIENRTEKPLIHAKENYDYWQETVRT